MERREIMKGAGALATAVTGVGGASTAAGQWSRASVRIIGTSEPLRGGQWLNVHARITNHGFGRLNGNARLIVGNDPDQVDSRSVSIPPNGSRTVTLGYRTYEVNTTDIFPVRIECAGGFDSRTVRVAPAP